MKTELFIRMYRDGFTIKEIAERFRMPEAEVKSYLMGYINKPMTKRKIFYKNLDALILEKFGDKKIAAYKMGISENTLYTILIGTANPGKSIIDAILGALDITYEEAFREDGFRRDQN